MSDFCLFYLFLYLCISWFILYFLGGQDWTSYMLTDCLPSNCKKKLLKNTYLLNYLTYSRRTTTHKLQTSLISCGKSFLERDLPKYRWLIGNIHTTQKKIAPSPFVIVKATKGGTDTILYSQHATKIGSHNGQG